MSNYPDIKLDDVMKFGKHKGETMRELLEHYPFYVRYLVDYEMITLANDAYAVYAKILERE